MSGQRRCICFLCLAVGGEVHFKDKLDLQSHLNYHKQGLVTFVCKKCQSVVVNREKEVEEHFEKECFEPAVEEEDLNLRSNRIRQREQLEESQCFLCLADFTGRSAATLLSHIEECQKKKRVEMNERNRDEHEMNGPESENVHDERDVGNEGNFNWTGTKTDELLFKDFGPVPVWKEQRRFGYGKKIDPHKDFICDAILLNTIRASGIVDVSDNTFKLLYDILNSEIFKENYSRNDGSLSKSYDTVKRREKKAFGALFEQVEHNNSVCFVRDLKEVLEEMFSDQAFLDARLDPDKSCDGYNDGEMRFENDWIYFPNAQERIRQCRERAAELQPMGLWLDEGEMDEAGNPIYLIVLFPLNCPKSFCRRPDVCYPIAYTYSASKITDCIRYLLPQFEALKTIGRIFPKQNQVVYISIEGIAGDFPAKAKLLMRTQVAVAGSPCNECLLKNDKNLSDTSRWNAEPRTQVRSKYFATMRIVLLKYF